MASRGLWHFMGARTRRGLALSWSALFVLSLLLQYFSFALAPSALAVHDEGLFELDGNATAGDAAPPIGPADDWSAHPGATGNRFTFIDDLYNSSNDIGFTGGGSKDDLNTSSWQWEKATVTPDKDDIEHAYAASYDSGGHTFVYFGLDKLAVNGDSNVGFWFFKNGIGLTGGPTSGGFAPQHTVGDLLVLSQFTNGGVVSIIDLYEWVGSGGSNGTLDKIASGNACTGSPAVDKACAVANTGPVPAPWAYHPKSGTDNIFPTAAFFEGGIDLDALFAPGKAPCFSGFLADTRTSQDVNAVLKDVAVGGFNTCVPPTITTTSSSATADFGGSVTDTANLSGSNGNASGTVSFFICTPSQVTAAGCPDGAGSQVGSAVTVNTAPNPDTATSTAYTVGLTAAAAGKYCWRAEYTPDANSQYLAGKHTNDTTECFTVAPATIKIEKTANPVGPVSAGSEIGFDIKVTNTNATQTTLGVSVTDNLPTGITWIADAPTGDITGVSCSIDTAPTPDVLHCTDASMTHGQNFTVHIHGFTDAADCGIVSNTANVATSNDGSDSATATVTVQCPDIKVTKTPDGASVDAGGVITWTIKVENIGDGTATGVVLTDSLPTGIIWSNSDAGCQLTSGSPQVLTCTVGTLAKGASKTYTVTGTSSKANCGPIVNTASATATNEPSNVLTNNSDNGSVTVLCATVTIGKTANPVGPVSAGSPIGFDLTWGNSTAGAATGVTVSDDLPIVPGVFWSISGSTGTGSTCIIAGSNPQVLTCTGFDIPGNTAVSGTVHITSGTDKTSCAVVNNTGHITTTNDGSAEASASVTVQCPDIKVEKSGNGPVFPGQPATFTIVLTNLGPGAATGVTLDDQLPTGTWTKGGADAASCTIVANLLHCNFGTVANGGTRTVTVTKTAVTADCANIHNDVTVGATNEPAGVLGNNSANADIGVICADVHVLKTADNGTINAGDTAAFTITASNAGPGTAKGVTLTDNLPAGVTWSEDSASCSIAAGVLSCNFGDLASGASAVVHVTGKTDNGDCAGLDNTAVVAALNEKAADQTDNESSASIDVNCPDIGVTKVADVGTISAGDTAAFTVVITNHGPGTAFDVHVADTLPAGVTWTIDPAVTGCPQPVGTALTCDFTSLADGASVTLHIKGETKAANCGNLHNAVVVSASNEVPDDQFPNSASADITVLCPTIVITKTADKATVSAGDGIGFVIEVTNTGDGNAFAVTVSDTLPTNAGLGWSIDAANSSAGWSITNGVLSFGPATLAGHASTHVHIVSGTTAATCGNVPNLASVTYTGGQGSDDSAVEVDCPDITVVKTPDGGTVNAGQNAVFTIVVSNSSAEGTGTAHNVTLSDPLPAGYVWTLGGTDKSFCSINTVPSPDLLSCNFGDLAPGASRTITLTAPTTGNNCAVIPNTATVAASNEAPADTDNNSDSASIDVTCPDIQVVKDAPNTPIPVGQNLVYKITTSNIGDGIALGVVLKDTLPVGFNWAVDNTSDCAIVAGVLTCNFGDMDPGDSITVTLTAPTSADPETGNVDCKTLIHQIPNVASATSSNEGESVLGNNSDDANITVLCSALSIDKSFTGNSNGTDPDLNVPSAKIGDTLHYTLHYTGAGPIADAVITDVLPQGLEYVVGSAAGDANFTFDSYNPATRTLKWVAAEGLPDPADGTVTYDVKVLATAPDFAQPLVNVATIVGHTPTGSELTDSDTAAVAVLAPPEELTPPPTSTITPQTGTSNPGFALMLILLGVAGLTLGIGFITPAPARVRRRDRLG